MEQSIKVKDAADPGPLNPQKLNPPNNRHRSDSEGTPSGAVTAPQLLHRLALGFKRP